MTKDSIEYKTWIRSNIIMAVFALVLSPLCALLLGALERSGPILFLPTAAFIVGIVIVILHVVTGYIFAQRMFNMRMRGKSPLDRYLRK